MKKFYQILLLFIFLSSTAAALTIEGCKYGGTCSVNDFTSNKYTTIEKATDGPCYYYKCRIGDHMVMEGSGSYDDFINTCKYIEPKILFDVTSAKINWRYYMYNDYDLILAVCDDSNQEECQKVLTNKDSRVHKQFYEGLKEKGSAFNLEPPKSCTYNNTPLVQLPQVQCESGGICERGISFRYDMIKEAQFVTKTCDACVMFVCSLDGKKIIEGSGCYDDFVKACKNVNPGAVKRFNVKYSKNKDGIKNNFYHDDSMIVASCSDADNCHKYAFDYYMTDNIMRHFYVNDSATEKCSYEEMIESTAPLHLERYNNGITSVKLFFGIYYILALVY